MVNNRVPLISLKQDVVRVVTLVRRELCAQIKMCSCLKYFGGLKRKKTSSSPDNLGNAADRKIRISSVEKVVVARSPTDSMSESDIWLRLAQASDALRVAGLQATTSRRAEHVEAELGAHCAVVVFVRIVIAIWLGRGADISADVSEEEGAEGEIHNPVICIPHPVCIRRASAKEKQNRDEKRRCALEGGPTLNNMTYWFLLI